MKELLTILIMTLKNLSFVLNRILYHRKKIEIIEMLSEMTNFSICFQFV
jgi:hypothetical protein